MKSNDISFCLSLIGLPWVSGNSGPDSFDRWGLVRYSFEKRRNVRLREYLGVSEIGEKQVSRLAETESAIWEQLEKPVHFCAVAMSRNRFISHVGIWLEESEGGIFHCLQGGGVVFQSPTTIRQTGIQNFKFYQLKP